MLKGLTLNTAPVWTGKAWKRACFLAVLSGMAAGLAPEPVKAWPLMWIALVPLWILVVSTRPVTWRANVKNGVLGACWGLGYYGVVLIWITGLHPLTWMGVPWLASVAIALFAWVVVTGWGMIWSAIWASVLGWISGRLFSFPSSPMYYPMVTASLRVLIATALWCAIDWLWSQGFLYWPSLAFTQSPNNLWVLQIGQWSGPITVTASILVVNGFLAEGILLWQAPQKVNHLGSQATQPEPFHPKFDQFNFRDSHYDSSAKRCGAIALSIFLGLHVIGGILYYQPLTSYPDDSLTIGIIQGNVPTRIKLYEEGLRRAFTGYTEGYRNLVNQGVDAVLTPEGAIPIFWRAPLNIRTPIYQTVLEQSVPIWLGTFVPIGRDFTQSIITLDGNGEVVSQYNKVKLVPLGEYVPFATVLGDIVDRLSPLDAYMIPGTVSQQFKTPFGQAIVGICYESAFAHLFRQQTVSGGEFILTASNNDPYNTVMMAQHHAQDVMRAIETDRWAVRATNTGYSGVVDPHGRTLWRSDANVYETYVASIYRRHTQSPYVRYGDWLTPLLIIGAIVISIFYGFMLQHR